MRTKLCAMFLFTMPPGVGAHNYFARFICLLKVDPLELIFFGYTNTSVFLLGGSGSVVLI